MQINRDGGAEQKDNAPRYVVSSGTISNYVSGTTNINAKALIRICTALDIPNDEIIKYL